MTKTDPRLASDISARRPANSPPVPNGAAGKPQNGRPDLDHARFPPSRRHCPPGRPLVFSKSQLESALVCGLSAAGIFVIVAGGLVWRWISGG